MLLFVIIIFFCSGLASVLGSHLLERENKRNIQVFNIGSIGTSSVSKLFNLHQHNIVNHEINGNDNTHPTHSQLTRRVRKMLYT